jgi:hypothetical protein
LLAGLGDDRLRGGQADEHRNRGHSCADPERGADRAAEAECGANLARPRGDRDKRQERNHADESDERTERGEKREPDDHAQ